MSSSTIRAVRTALLLATCAWMGLAQTAQISGSIVDSSGAVVADANIAVKNLDTGIVRSTASNASGVYAVPGLRPGTYELTVRVQGFKTVSRGGIVLETGMARVVDVEIQLGATVETVAVEEKLSLEETSTASLGTVITQEKVANLPLNGRNFTQLLTLTPGATPVSTGQNRTGAQSQQVGTIVMPSINGQTNRSNSFTLDGAFNNAVYQGSYGVSPNVDAILQFQVASHSDQAEHGGVTGGVVSIITKGGTNDFHGALYHFLRNDALDARAFFSATKPTLRQNQFGAVLGGPVKRNRTFFLFGYEGFRQVNASNILTVVPTPAELGGDFSGSARAIYDPFSTREDPARPGTFLRDPFAGNRIPAARLDRSTQAWAKDIIPAPINTGFSNSNMRNASPQRRPANNYNLRVDHQLSTKQFLWGRYTWGEQNSEVALALPGTRQFEDRPARNLAFNYTNVLDTSTVLSFLFSYSSLRQVNTPVLANRDYFADGYFTGVPKTEFLTVPGINLPGAFGRLTTRRSDRGPMEGWQWRGDLSKVKGAHTLKMGGELIRHPWFNYTTDFELGFNTVQTSNLSSQGNTGNAIASFVLGVPEDRTFIYPLLKLESRTSNFYFQDSWRVSPKVTVNLGLRWDLFNPPTLSRGIPATWDFNTGKFLVGANKPPACGTAPCLVDPNNAYVNQYVVFTGQPRLRDNDYRLPAPRVGVAYRARPTLVVRGSFGVFYDLYAGVNQQGQNSTGGGWPVPDSFLNQALNRTTVALTANSPFQDQAVGRPALTPENITAFFFDPKFRVPYSLQWHVDVQKDLGGRLFVNLGYVGSNTERLAVGGSYNTALTPGPGAIRPRALWPNAPVTDYDRSVASSSYHGLQMKAEHRLAHGFSAIASYTWSKTIDSGSSGSFGVEDQSLQNPYDLAGSRSVAGFDIPHYFAAGVLYELPFGPGKPWLTQGWAGRVLGRWQWNGIFSRRSGQPFTPVTNLDIANIGAQAANTRVRPNLLRDPRLANPSPDAWFDRTAFAAPAQYTFGSAGRNQLRTDPLLNLDLSLFREDRIGERFRTQLRIEAFNVANHATFGTPDVLFTSARFGTVSGTVSTARQVQLGLKLLF